MEDLIISFEGKTKDLNDFVFDLFEAHMLAAGLEKETPGYAKLVLKPMGMRKSALSQAVIDVGLFIEVCQLFCVNDQVLFLGWVREGRGSIPSLAQRCRRILRFHDAARSMGGIRSGHRIVKWLSASRQ